MDNIIGWVLGLEFHDSSIESVTIDFSKFSISFEIEKMEGYPSMILEFFKIKNLHFDNLCNWDILTIDTIEIEKGSESEYEACFITTLGFGLPSANFKFSFDSVRVKLTTGEDDINIIETIWSEIE